MAPLQCHLPPTPPYHNPPVLLLQFCGGLGQPVGQILPLQQAVVLAELLQVPESVVCAQQLGFCNLELPCQVVTAGAGLVEHPSQCLGLSVVLA